MLQNHAEPGKVQVKAAQHTFSRPAIFLQCCKTPTLLVEGRVEKLCKPQAAWYFLNTVHCQYQIFRNIDKRTQLQEPTQKYKWWSIYDTELIVTVQYNFEMVFTWSPVEVFYTFKRSWLCERPLVHGVILQIFGV